MKIDDPQVQKYISGQMSAEEERSFRSVLVDHPEVADLADTLKRTSRLIREDQASGDSPYGRGAPISTPQSRVITTSKKDEDAPNSGLALYSYKLMGNSWRVGVTILSVTLATLFLLLVVVPFVRSAVQVQSGGDFETEFQKLVEEQKKNEAKGFMSESRNIPTHGQADSATKAPTKDLNLAAAFDYLLDPSKRILTAEVLEQISDMGKIGLNSTGTDGSVALPLAYETELAEPTIAQIKSGRPFEGRIVQPDAWMNRFVQVPADPPTSAPKVSYRLEPAPWSRDEILLFIHLQAPQQVSQSGWTNVGLFAASGEESPAAWNSAFRSQGLNFMTTEGNFSMGLEPMIKSSLQKNSPLILFIQAGLTLNESHLLRQKLEQMPKLSLRIVWGGAQISESARLVRSFFTTYPERGFFLHAPTPTLVKKALRIASMKSPTYWTDASLKWIADKKIWSSSSVVGSRSLNSEFYSATGWLAPGDQVLTAIRLTPTDRDQILNSQIVGNLKFEFRSTVSPQLQVVKIPVDWSRPSPELPHESVRFASLILWLGLGLKQEIAVGPKWISDISKHHQALALPDSFLPAYQEFATLLEALR